MKVVHSITLDVKKTNVQKVIHANQGEGLDRKLEIRLVSGNETLNLDGNNQSASLVATKPDGTNIYNTAKIKNGRVYIYLTTQTVAAVGDVTCQLKITSVDSGSVGSGVIYSAKFAIDVEAPLYSDSEIESTNEFSELVELTQKLEKQVTVYSGEGTPDTDPDTYEDIKESDFYYDETNKLYYYATSVTTTITWKRIYNKDEVDTLLDLKADKSTTYTKTEVDTMVNPKARVWEGINAPNTQISIGTTYTGIKKGDIYLYDTGVVGAQPIPCVVVYVNDDYNHVFVVNELKGVMVKSTNPPSSMEGNNYIELKNGTMWLNTTTKRVYIKVGESGEMPSTTYVWQDLTGNRVWFGDDNPDDDTALGKITIGTDYVGIKEGDTYIYNGNAGYNNSNHIYNVINVGTTYAYMKKTKNVFYGSSALTEKPINDKTTANLTWQDWEKVFEAGTIYIYNGGTYVIKNVIQTELNGKTTVTYYYDTFDFVNYGDYYPAIENLQNGKQDKIDSTHKLDADLLSDGTTNKPSVWNAKQDAISAGNGIDITSNTISAKPYSSSDNALTNSSSGLMVSKTTLGLDPTLREKLADPNSSNPLVSKSYTDTELGKKQPTIDSSHKLDSDNVDDSESTNKFVSAAEKAAIGKEPKYELIKTIDISQFSEPVSSIIVSSDEDGNAFAYDDFLIDTIGVKAGADNCKYTQTLYCGSATTKQLKLSRNNTLGTTAKSITTEFNRRSIDAWSYNMFGDYSQQNGGKLDLSAYTDKVPKIYLTTDTAGFTDGIIKVYGKVKY